MLSPWDAWNQQMIALCRTIRAAYAADIDANHLISMACIRGLDHD